MPHRSDALVFVADAEMRYVAVNETACRVLGYSRDELLGLRVTDVAVAPEAADLYREMIADRVQLGMTLLRSKEGASLAFHYFAQEARGGPYYVSAGFVGDGSEWRQPGRPSVEDAEEHRSNVLADVNDRIHELAAELQDPDVMSWEFLCECGREGCNGRLVIPLAEYTAVRRRGDLLLQPGHSIALARQARRVAAEIE